jgi:hypothetical protein
VTLWCKVGQLASENNQLRLARYAFEQCLLLNPNHWYSIQKLAETLYCLGDEESCLFLIETYLKKSELWSELSYLIDSILKNNGRHYEKERIYRFCELEEQWKEKSDTSNINMMDDLKLKRFAYMNRDLLQTSQVLAQEFHLHELSWEALGNLIIYIYEKVDKEELTEITPIKIAVDERTASNQVDSVIEQNISMGPESDMIDDEELKYQNTTLEVTEKDPKRKKYTATDTNSMRVSKRVKEKQEEEKAKMEDQADFKHILKSLIPNDALSLIQSTEFLSEGKFEESFQAVIQDRDMRRLPKSKNQRMNCHNTYAMSAFFTSRNDKLQTFGFPYLDNTSVKTFLEDIMTSHSGICTIAYRFLLHVCLDPSVWPSLSFTFMVLNIIYYLLRRISQVSHQAHHIFQFEANAESFQLALAWAENILDYIIMNQKYSLNWFDPVDLSQLLGVKNVLEDIYIRSLGILSLENGLKERLLWFLGRLEIYEDQIDKAEESLTQLSNLLHSTSTDINTAVVLVHCVEEFTIQSDTVNAKLLEIDNEYHVYEAKELFNAGNFSEVVDRLSPIISKTVYMTRKPSFWRIGEMHLFLVDSLIQLERFDEALKLLFDSLDDSMEQLLCKEWKSVYELIQLNLEKIIFIMSHQTAISLPSCMQGELLSRWLMYLMKVAQMTQILMEYDNVEFQETYSLPWIALFHILRQVYVTSSSQSTENVTYHDDLHELLARAHHELGKRHFCTADHGKLLKLCIDVFSTRTDEDSVAERNQCYYCLYGLNLDVRREELQKPKKYLPPPFPKNPPNSNVTHIFYSFKL